MRLARRWTLATLVAALLAIPSIAHAVSYCVNAPGCAGDAARPDLQTALNAARGPTTEADTVTVGDPGVPTADRVRLYRRGRADQSR